MKDNTTKKKMCVCGETCKVDHDILSLALSGLMRSLSVVALILPGNAEQTTKVLSFVMG